MSKLTAKNKLFIAIGVLVAVVLAVIFLLIVPKVQEASDLQTQIDNENTNLLAAQTLLARRQSAKAQSAANEAELMDIANMIPDSPQLPTVIIEIQNVANMNDVTLAQISPNNLEDGDVEQDGDTPAYSVLPIDLVIEGQWRDIIDFLGDIDDLDRGVRVVSSTFTYVTDDQDTAGDDSHIEATVSIEVYVMAAATTTGSGSASGTAGTNN